MEKNITNTKPRIKLDENFFRIKDDEKITYLVFFILITCFILGYFSLMPILNNYKANKIVLTDNTNEKATLEEKQKVLTDLEKELTRKSSVIERTKYVLPTDPQIPEILTTLESIASKNSLYINGFSPLIAPVTTNNKTEPPSSYKKMEIQFDVTGSYLNFKEFLKEIENNIRPIDILSINASSSGGLLDKESELLKFSLKGNIYYQ